MFAARREHVEQVIRPALARGALGGVRPLHRRDLRLPGRRARRVARAASRALAAHVHGDCQPGPHAAVRRAAVEVSRARLDAGARGRPHARQVRARGGGILRPRARRLSRARGAPSRALPRRSTRRCRSPTCARGSRRCSRRCERRRSDDDARCAGCARRRRAAAVARAGRAATCSRGARAGRMRCCITGPQGIGKRDLALHVRARRCCARRRAPTASRAARAPSCRYVAAGQHPDLRVVEPFEVDDDGEREAGRVRSRVDRIRALIDWAQLTSHRRRRQGGDRSRPRSA